MRLAVSATILRIRAVQSHLVPPKWKLYAVRLYAVMTSTMIKPFLARAKMRVIDIVYFP
jgi:hypothetical protein